MNWFQFGENLKNLRESHGLTLRQLALKLGVTYQQVQKYEKGRNKLPIDKLYRLHVIYDVDFDCFFKGCFKNSEV